MTLRQTLRAGVAAIAVAAVIAPAGIGSANAGSANARSAGAGSGRAAPPGIDVRVAQADGFSRIEFQGAPQAQVKRDGQVVTLNFPRDGDPDIARLRTSPPKWIKTAEKRHAGGHLQIVLTLSDDADYKVGASDGAMFVNVFQKAPPTAAELAAAHAGPPEPPRPNPIPAGGDRKSVV